MRDDATTGQTAKPRQVTALSAPALAAVYLALCLLPLVLAVTGPVASAAGWERAAAALGMVALAAMAVQAVTSGRLGFVSDRIGIDKVMAFHKISAWWVLAALVLHPLFYVAPTWAANPALGAERLWAYLTLPHYRSGVAALAALALLVGSSALRDRLPWRYEAWRASHVILALVALFGGLHHALAVGRFAVLPALGPLWWATGVGVALVFLLLYLWRPMLLHLRPWRLASVTALADRMWELDLRRAGRTPPLAYEAGQFVWMSVGSRRFPLFDHPFSIAGTPRQDGLRLVVKEAGDFTTGIGAIAPGTPVGIDGPYGHFTLSAHPARAILLLAGGVGIAPILGLLRDLAAVRDPRPVRLGYAAGRPDNFAALDEIAAAGGRIDLRTLLVAEAAGPGWAGETGRLDRARLAALLEGLETETTVALICGPGPMVSAVSDTLLDLGLPVGNVIYERFDYSGGSSRQDRRLRRRYLALGAGLGLGVLAFVLPFAG